MVPISGSWLRRQGNFLAGPRKKQRWKKDSAKLEFENASEKHCKNLDNADLHIFSTSTTTSAAFDPVKKHAETQDIATVRRLNICEN